MAVRWQAGMGEATQKRVTRLHDSHTRRRDRRFLVEGRRAVEEMLATGVTPERLVVREGLDWQPGPLPDAVTVHLVTPKVMSRLTTLRAQPDLLAVFKEPHPPFPFSPWPRRVLAAHGVQDPGNLGTLLRSAAAFGAGHVVLLKGCTDPFAPKAIRAVAGLLPHLTLSWEVAPQDFFAAAQAAKATVLALAPDAPQDMAPVKGPAVLLVGSEGQGLKGLDLSNCQPVRLPGPDPALPLNVAVAASLGLYVLWGQKK